MSEPLWKTQGLHLPEEIKKLANKLMRSGAKVNGEPMTKSTAIATAVSRAKYWAATSKDPKVKAKWAAVVAEWEADKAKARSTP